MDVFANTILPETVSHFYLLHLDYKFKYKIIKNKQNKKIKNTGCHNVSCVYIFRGLILCISAISTKHTILDCTSDFIGTHTSCANVDGFYISIIFNDFYFLYVGFPFSVCTSTNLTTVNADSMTFDLAFFTNFTSSHCLHLLKRLYVTQQSYSSRK